MNNINEHPLGLVSEVHGSAVTVTIDPISATSIQIGELVLVQGITACVVGEVLNLQRSGSTQARVKLLASIDIKSHVISPGARELPGLGAEVRRPSPAIISAILEDRSSVLEHKREEVLIDLAESNRYNGFELAFSPERLIGRHLAVVGSSGGGKSCTVARLIEGCGAYRSKVILLDLTGEYEPLKQRVFQVHIGECHRSQNFSSPTSMPYYELTEADLISIFEPEDKLQLVKLQAAIRSLKVVQLEPRLGTDGVFPKAHKEKRAYEQAMEDFKLELDQPENHFDIYKLPLQIELECVDIYRSQTETGFWGGIHNDDLAGCSSIIQRIESILARGDLAALFMPNTAPSLINTIDTFFEDEKISVLRISFEFLPSIHHVREIVANAIARKLLDMGRKRLFMKQPVLLLLDEAHQVLRPGGSQFSRDFPLDAYPIIAKEGRKYGLSLCVATQRPGDIPEDILSQMGTFIIHRLVGTTDRNIIERATGACDLEMLADLPSLTPGEAIIVGSAFSRPLRVRIKFPKNSLVSHGPNYQVLWR